MKKYPFLAIILFSIALPSCKNYLDVVPDNVATIDFSFRLRSAAEKYFFTCYSFLPIFSNRYANPALYGADEFWVSSDKASTWPNVKIAVGTQNSNNPVLNYWDGTNSGKNLWEGIRDCNIFIKNIGKVPDMKDFEKKQWAAEVTFLKAYYYFFLLRMYGPVPLLKENIPVSASVDAVRLPRAPVDSVFSYIISLIDKSVDNLPDEVKDEQSELGRITKPIAMGMKAKILVYAASPLFNGNSDYSSYKNTNGTLLFNQNVEKSKWEKAAKACKDAIDLCQNLGYKLYKFEGDNKTRNISDETRNQLTIREVLTDRWNSEIIWAYTGSSTLDIQDWTAPRVIDPTDVGRAHPNGSNGVPLKIAALFYTKNGLPIDEDSQWDYNARFSLETATEKNKYNIKEGYTTAKFNFDRGPRFYGSLGFDGGVWYGDGEFDDKDNPHYLQLKKGQIGGKVEVGWHSVTGYYAKKYIPYSATWLPNNVFSTTNWPWVMLRLSGLNLLYAEALNELNGPDPMVYKYLNDVRSTVGLPNLEDSWTKYSKHPDKYKTKEGLRAIIHRERAIELAFEGQRFWDLRRWKTAPKVLNASIKGWNVDMEKTNNYYQPTVLFDQKFNLKDYFWPISVHALTINHKLNQSPGW